MVPRLVAKCIKRKKHPSVERYLCRTIFNFTFDEMFLKRILKSIEICLALVFEEIHTVTLNLIKLIIS